MWIKTGDDQYVLWEKVEWVQFEKHEGLLIKAHLFMDSQTQLTTQNKEYAKAIWEKMFPTIRYDIP